MIFDQMDSRQDIGVPHSFDLPNLHGAPRISVAGDLSKLDDHLTCAGAGARHYMDMRGPVLSRRVEDTHSEASDHQHRGQRTIT